MYHGSISRKLNATFHHTVHLNIFKIRQLQQGEHLARLVPGKMHRVLPRRHLAAPSAIHPQCWTGNSQCLVQPVVRHVSNVDLGRHPRVSGGWASKGFGRPGYPATYPKRQVGLDLNLQVGQHSKKN